MGRPLIHQRRGKGSPSFTAPSHRFKGRAKYRTYDDAEKKGVIKAQIIDFIDDPGRSSILMQLMYEDNKKCIIPAAEGVIKGNLLESGSAAQVNVGNTLPLTSIPEGYPIFNIEAREGDGGNFVRSSGECAYVVSREAGKVRVKLPSRRIKTLSNMCRATIGCVAGGGRKEKPLLKAGKGSYKHKARGHWYPTVRGVHMNACDHPFGGKQHHGAKTTKGKRGSTGQHVGSFGSRRTGRRKR